MKKLPSCSACAVSTRRAPFFSAAVTGVLALAVTCAGLLPSTARAQPGLGGPGGGPFDHRDLRVEADPRGGPRFFAGPGRNEFVFVRGVPAGRFISSRDLLLSLLLQPAVDSVVWGLGDVATLEVANLLGVPMHTTLYAVQPGISVVSGVPAGYFVAEAVPQNVALVTNSVAGPVVLVRRVPPGTFIAYQSNAAGLVVNECIVVPPVQQVLMVPTVATPAPTVVVGQPAPAPAATPAPAPTPAPAAAPAPSNKVGSMVYDANGKPIGVIVTEGNGTTQFIPVGAQ